MIWSGYRNAPLTRAVERFEHDVNALPGSDGGRLSPRKSLMIDCASDDAAFLSLEQKEGYHLAVDASGERSRDTPGGGDLASSQFAKTGLGSPHNQ